MATPPAGWILTGDSFDYSGSLTVQIAGVLTSFALEPIAIKNPVSAGDDIYIGIESSGGAISCGAWGSRDSVSVYTRKEAELFAARTTEQTIPGGCPQPYLSVVVQRTVVGARLIANVDVDTATGATRYRTRLWLDETTTDTLQVGSKTQVLDWTGGAIVASPSIVVEHEAVPFLASPPPQLENGIIITASEWGDLGADPTMFDPRPMRAFLFPAGSGGTVWSHTTKPPLHYQVNLRVEDAAGLTPAGAVTVGLDTLTNPAVQEITTWRWSSSAITAALSGDWSADGVDLPSAERTVPLRQLKPKAPSNSPQFWTPATYEVTSPLSVLQSSDVFTGTGSVIVSGPGGLVWDVSGAASVERILNATYDASDGYLTTKHTAGEDVWGWGLYAYLDVDIIAPAAGDLTLVIRWVAAGASPITADKTYTVPIPGAGTHQVRVDLLFPQEGGPWYAERVDRLTFSDLQSGSYTLNSLELVAVENAYVKVHASGGATGLDISQDGAFAVGWWGDNPLLGGVGPEREKDDESGFFDTGGTPDTSAGGCVRMDGTLEDVVDEWNRMEGVTVTYDGSAIDADLTDGTNVIGTEDELSAVPLTYRATWYHTQMGLRSAPNATTSLPASIYLDGGADLCPAPAGTFVLPFRHVIGAVLEAQCKDSVTGLRAGAGAEVFARRSASGAPTSSDPLLASGETDASGFASIAIRTGTVGGAEFNAGLLGS